MCNFLQNVFKHDKWLINLVESIFVFFVAARPGIHAKVLAPRDVRFLRYPEDVPQYTADDCDVNPTTVILYPSKVGL